MFSECALMFAAQVEALKKYRSTGANKASSSSTLMCMTEGKPLSVALCRQGEGEIQKAMINRRNLVHRLQTELCPVPVSLTVMTLS
jgi:hypothetical protein